MASLRINDLTEFLLHRELLSVEQRAELESVFPPSSEPKSVLDELSKRGWLTAYQAEQISSGRGAELFLGPYVLLELLGEGGMGQVFKATHRRLRRQVALKVIRDKLDDPDLIRRFQREAQAAAQMCHQNVVTIYDADQVNDTHFIAMEYVDGVDLGKLVRDAGPLPVAKACDYIRQAALGLSHAHLCGLVHRDIKPSNLFVCLPHVTRSNSSRAEGDTFATPGETVHTGNEVVKILDMGLARLVHHRADSKSFQTQAGAVMGTPDYMSPEQARNSSRVDIRADLYSLGCTFYCLLTGRPPFPEGSPVEKLLMHQLDEPTPIAELRAGVSAEVETIIRTLMAKDPNRRYQVPNELVQALEELGTATPAPAPALSAPPASASTLPPLRVDQQEQQAGVKEAGSVHVDMRPAAPSSEPKENGDVAAKPAGPESPKQIASLKGHRGYVLALAFSSDRNVLVSAGVDGSIRLWGFSSKVPGERVITAVDRDEIRVLALSPDNQTLACGCGSMDGRIHLWDLSGFKPQHREVFHAHQGPIDALAFSPDGKRLTSAGGDKLIHVWDLSTITSQKWATLKAHMDRGQALAYGQGGAVIACGGDDGIVRLWQPGKVWGSKLTVLTSHAGGVRTLAFSADGTMLASAGRLDDTIQLWDLTQTQPNIRTVIGEPGPYLVVFPADGKSLVSLNQRGAVRLRDVAGSSTVREWQLPETLVRGAAFTHDGRYVAVGHSDGQVAVFRLAQRTNQDPGAVTPFGS